MHDHPRLTSSREGVWELRAHELLIGRARENDVVVRDQGVSRQHARLHEEGGRWFVSDRGSRFGTFLNGVRVQPGMAHPLRHGDRIDVGEETFVFSAPPRASDPDETARFDVERLGAVATLSPFQRQVVTVLCAPWLSGGTLDDLPSNEEIAARLGTPDAADSVKASLRRIYAKAGLQDEPAAVKRRKLCVVARRSGWI